MDARFETNILNQTYNATRKVFDFYISMWYRTISLRYIAQLFIKRSFSHVSSVSTAQLVELKSDLSKQLFGSQTLSEGSKKDKLFSIPHSNISLIRKSMSLEK